MKGQPFQLFVWGSGNVSEKLNVKTKKKREKRDATAATNDCNKRVNCKRIIHEKKWSAIGEDGGRFFPALYRDT